MTQNFVLSILQQIVAEFLFSYYLGEHVCDCPSACHSYEYDLSISQSAWPATGIETDTAYVKLIEQGLIKDFEEINSTIAEKILEYLDNDQHRVEILKNFARVTVYNEKLSIERVQQVEAYTGVDLISDIGGCSLLSWVGVWVGGASGFTVTEFPLSVCGDIDRYMEVYILHLKSE